MADKRRIRDCKQYVEHVLQVKEKLEYEPSYIIHVNNDDVYANINRICSKCKKKYESVMITKTKKPNPIDLNYHECPLCFDDTISTSFYMNDN